MFKGYISNIIRIKAVKFVNNEYLSFCSLLHTS